MIRVKSFTSITVGFTLIELLVVITVVGVLAGAIITLVNPAAQIAKAQDAQRKQDIRSIANALERYAIDNGHYPITGNVSSWIYSTSDTWITGLSPYYLPRIPKDPINNGGSPWTEDQNYRYAYGSNGTYYNLVAKLKNTQDPDRCEIKKWFFISANTGTGNSWCLPGYTYSNRIYAWSSLGK